jgi:hypothetical protein
MSADDDVSTNHVVRESQQPHPTIEANQLVLEQKPAAKSNSSTSAMHKRPASASLRGDGEADDEGDGESNESNNATKKEQDELAARKKQLRGQDDSEEPLSYFLAASRKFEDELWP